MARNYAYVRVSTKSQSVERQIQNITRVCPDCEIFSETFTGTKMDRPQFNKMVSKLEKGDTVYFDEVSRFGRNADEAVEMYESLFNRGIDLIFLKEPYVSTTTYREKIKAQVEAVTISTGNNATDKFVGSIIDALNQYTVDLAKEQIRMAFDKAQFEVDMLHKRVKEGMRASGASQKIAEARTGQKYETKKSQKAKDIIRKKSARFDGSMNDTDCMTVCGISRGTFYRYIKEMGEVA